MPFRYTKEMFRAVMATEFGFAIERSQLYPMPYDIERLSPELILDCIQDAVANLNGPHNKHPKQTARVVIFLYDAALNEYAALLVELNTQDLQQLHTLQAHFNSHSCEADEIGALTTRIFHERKTRLIGNRSFRIKWQHHIVSQLEESHLNATHSEQALQLTASQESILQASIQLFLAYGIEHARYRPQLRQTTLAGMIAYQFPEESQTGRIGKQRHTLSTIEPAIYEQLLTALFRPDDLTPRELTPPLRIALLLTTDDDGAGVSPPTVPAGHIGALVFEFTEIDRTLLDRLTRHLRQIDAVKRYLSQEHTDEADLTTILKTLSKSRSVIQYLRRWLTGSSVSISLLGTKAVKTHYLKSLRDLIKTIRPNTQVGITLVPENQAEYWELERALQCFFTNGIDECNLRVAIPAPPPNPAPVETAIQKADEKSPPDTSLEEQLASQFQPLASKSLLRPRSECLTWLNPHKIFAYLLATILNSELELRQNLERGIRFAILVKTDLFEPPACVLLELNNLNKEALQKLKFHLLRYNYDRAHAEAELPFSKKHYIDHIGKAEYKRLLLARSPIIRNFLQCLFQQQTCLLVYSDDFSAFSKDRLLSRLRSVFYNLVCVEPNNLLPYPNYRYRLSVTIDSFFQKGSAKTLQARPLPTPDLQAISQSHSKALRLLLPQVLEDWRFSKENKKLLVRIIRRLVLLDERRVRFVGLTPDQCRDVDLNLQDELVKTADYLLIAHRLDCIPDHLLIRILQAYYGGTLAEELSKICFELQQSIDALHANQPRASWLDYLKAVALRAYHFVSGSMPGYTQYGLDEVAESSRGKSIAATVGKVKAHLQPVLYTPLYKAIDTLLSPQTLYATIHYASVCIGMLAIYPLFMLAPETVGSIVAVQLLAAGTSWALRLRVADDDHQGRWIELRKNTTHSKLGRFYNALLALVRTVYQRDTRPIVAAAAANGINLAYEQLLYARPHTHAEPGHLLDPKQARENTLASSGILHGTSYLLRSPVDTVDLIVKPTEDSIGFTMSTYRLQALLGEYDTEGVAKIAYVAAQNCVPWGNFWEQPRTQAGELITQAFLHPVSFLGDMRRLAETTEDCFSKTAQAYREYAATL